jgi:hypothetical protein
MAQEKMYAVLTGDVAGSSRFEGEQRQKLLSIMKQSFALVSEMLGDDVMAFPFEIFRGDSFQGVLQNPAKALKAALIIRAGLRRSFQTTLKDAVDARIAVGIGTISMLPDGRGGEGDGEAYRNSGPLLDKLTKESRFIKIVTPSKSLNQELDVECAMLDTIISRWSSQQAEVFIETWKGKTQEQIAAELNVSQPGIRKRILSSNIFPIELMNNRFEHLMQSFHQNMNTEL